MARRLCYPTQQLDGGVLVEQIQAGDGVTFPHPGDYVKMHYKGTLKRNGQQFDSSYEKGKPFVTMIGLGQVIRGWDIAVPRMSLGERAKIRIPSPMAYGSRGAPSGSIGPNEDLIFEVVLLDVHGKGSQAAATKKRKEQEEKEAAEELARLKPPKKQRQHRHAQKRSAGQNIEWATSRTTTSSTVSAAQTAASVGGATSLWGAQPPKGVYGGADDSSSDQNAEA